MLSIVNAVLTIQNVRNGCTTMAQSTLTNAVAARRTQKGWTQAQLAQRVGVTRPCISAVEAGKMVPSVAIALTLADVLGCQVEALFARPGPDQHATGRATEFAAHAEGTRVVIGRVAAGWQAHAVRGDLQVAADAVAYPDACGAVRFQWLRPADAVAQNLVVAGCDPALAIAAAHCSERWPSQAVRAISASSGRSLRWLRQGVVHAAGVHLGTAKEPTTNVPATGRALPGRRILLFRLARWPLVMAWTSPQLATNEPADALRRRGLRLVNREHGSGARAALDRAMAAAGLSAGAVRGYDRVLPSHEAVAQAVASGGADGGVTTLCAARAHGLAFVALEETTFDLAVPAELADDPRVCGLVEVLGSARFRQEVAALGGYDLHQAGQLVATLAAIDDWKPVAGDSP